MQLQPWEGIDSESHRFAGQAGKAYLHALCTLLEQSKDCTGREHSREHYKKYYMAWTEKYGEIFKKFL
jgi:hypothetical protein